MARFINLPIAFCLPAADVLALVEGRTILAMSRIFVNPGREFALYPDRDAYNPLAIEQYYHADFLPTARQALVQENSDRVQIHAWAKCDRCEILDREELDILPIIAEHAVWTTTALEEIIRQRGRIFLAYLRVYRLPEPREIPARSKQRYVSLEEALTVTTRLPVLSDTFFARRIREIQTRQVPQHGELEQLYTQIVAIADSNLAAKQIEFDLKRCLGWTKATPPQSLDSDSMWIEQIDRVGNSSDGHQFEGLVRQSLFKLGFRYTQDRPQASLDPEKTGGAAGLDFYADFPYGIVGKCKASQSETVPSSVISQLIYLGNHHLQHDYNACIKLVLAAGTLTQDALTTAVNNRISILRPETLQKLVQMQATYPNSIDLFRLKACLQNAYGFADEKVEQYLATVRQEIEVRSRLVCLVEQHLAATGEPSATLEAIRALYAANSPPKPLSVDELYEHLIELASPLTGYLGREPSSSDRGDRFYFLRPLVAPNSLADIQ